MKHISIFILFFFLSISTLYAKAITRSSLLPETALITVKLSDAEGFCKAIETSPMGELWKTNEMQEFLNGQSVNSILKLLLLDNDLKDKKAADKKFQLELEEFKMLKGEVSFSFISTAEGDDVIYISAEMNKKDYKNSLKMDRQIFDLEETHTTIKSKNFQGVKIHTYIEKDEQNNIQKIHQTHFKETLLASEDLEWLKSALVKLKKNDIIKQKEEPSCTLHVSPLVTRLLMNELKDGGNNLTLDTETIFKALGIFFFDGLTLKLTMQENKSELDVNIAHSSDGKGVWALFPDKNIPMDFKLPYVPEDIYSYELSHIDLNGLWAQIPAIIGTINPDYLPKFNNVIEQVGSMVNINLNDDLFANLDSLHFKFAQIEGLKQNFIYGIKLNNQNHMKKVLDTLFSENSFLRMQIAENYTNVNLDENIIHIVRLPSNESGDPDEIQYNSIAFAVSFGAFIFGTEQLITDFVESSSSTAKVPLFYKNQLYQKSASVIPSDVSGFSIGNASEVVEFILEKMNTSDIGEMMNNSLDETQKENEKFEKPSHFFSKLNFDKIPPNEVVSRYIGNSIGFYTSKEKSIQSRIVLFYPKTSE